MGDDDTGTRIYSGETVIVPLDLENPDVLRAIEEEVGDVVDDIEEGEAVYVAPRSGGDAIEVRVLSEDAV